MNRRSRIGLLALTLSLLLHAAAVLLVSRAPAPPSTLRAGEPIWLESAGPVRAPEMPAAAGSSPEGRPPQPEAVRRSRRGAPREAQLAPSDPRAGAQPRPAASFAGAEVAGESDAAGSSSAEEAPPAAAGVPVVPRRLVLTPSTEALPQAKEDLRHFGRTLRNDGSPLPKGETPALAAARTKKLIDGWIEDDQALIRAEEGMVDDYFGRMRLALSRKASDMKAPEQHRLWASIRDGVAEGLRAYTDAAKSYGASGNPYVAAMPDPASAGETALEREAATHPGGAAEGLLRKGREAQTLRDFADGKLGSGLLAVVELRQSGDGRLVGETLLASSGNRLFDEHVLRSAPSALMTLPAPPAAGMGIHAEGLRSHWEFRGHWIYKRKLRDLGPEQLYLLALLPASLVTGNFDETTGDIFLVDPGNPQFECRVRLLRLY